MKNKQVINPIIPGFNPDPSIIRVDDNFYIVNSSFEYFPAIPIFQSKDLIHWKQIGNVVSKKSQGLDLSEVNASGGVQAATIRYHDGIYYVTSTRIKKYWPRLDYHFICTAKNPKGPWSKCHFIDNAEGIDSSLFFDDNGKSYFLANRQKDNETDGNKTEIWISEIDLHKFKLIGEKRTLWGGTGGIYPEGPRLFKKNGQYILLIAEGGTLHHHSVTCALSDHVFGPYVSSKRNPILSHKHLNRTYPIQNVGHADMVELKDHTWWGVCLGSRPRGGFYDGGNIKYSFGGYYRNLGRETFLFPVDWPSDRQGPIFSGDTGKIEFSYPSSNLAKDIKYDFSKQSLKIKWIKISDQYSLNYQLVGKDCLQFELKDNWDESFLGVRQNDWNFVSSFDVDVSNLTNDDCFAFIAYIKPGSYIGLEIYCDHIDVVSSYQFQKEIIKSINDIPNHLHVELQGDDQDYCFTFLNQKVVVDGKHVSCDLNDAHTGVIIAFSGHSDSQHQVFIEKFTYFKRKK